MTTRNARPTLAPIPKQNRPLAQPKGDKYERSRALMSILRDAVEGSEGKITRASLAASIGKYPQDVVQWLAGSQNPPNLETGLAMLAGVATVDKSVWGKFKESLTSSK